MSKNRLTVAFSHCPRKHQNPAHNSAKIPRGQPLPGIISEDPVFSCELFVPPRGAARRRSVRRATLSPRPASRMGVFMRPRPWPHNVSGNGQSFLPTAKGLTAYGQLSSENSDKELFCLGVGARPPGTAQHPRAPCQKKAEGTAVRIHKIRKMTEMRWQGRQRVPGPPGPRPPQVRDPRAPGRGRPVPLSPPPLSCERPPCPRRESRPVTPVDQVAPELARYDRARAVQFASNLPGEFSPICEAYDAFVLCPAKMVA